MEQITVSATNVPPCGKPPRANEIINETAKIQITSKKVKPKLEYERKIVTKQTDVTNAVPPRAKIEKSGREK